MDTRVRPTTLTVFSRGGLANRIRVLLSGLAVAEATGRAFTMVWPRTPFCGAAFRELFANDWPVEDVDALHPSLEPHYVRHWSAADGRRLLRSPQPDLIVGLYTWVIPPGDDDAPQVGSRAAALLAELEPIASLARRAADTKATRFREPMIGVHLRRGDFVRSHPDIAGNTREAMAEVSRMLAVVPHAGIFLCSDDGAPDSYLAWPTRREGVHAAFAARYGARVVSSTARSLDRRATESVQDALVDLLLLRQTAMVVGTEGSSFSELAVFGRKVPHVFVKGGVPAYRPFAFLERVPAARTAVVRVLRVALEFRRAFPQAVRRLWRRRSSASRDAWRA